MNYSLLKPLLLRAIMTLSLVYAWIPSFAGTEQIEQNTVQQQLAELEASADGRLGVFALNTADNTHLWYRARERFPMCSTNKIMGVAAILQNSVTDNKLLQQKITYQAQDLVTYSPITKKHIADGMTVAELCTATMTLSDNSAINLLMQKMGGLNAVNAFARSIGDNAFRLDRWEPELNSAIPGDLRDTSTPEAMGESLYQLTFGDILALPQQQQLQTWLKDNTTGDARIRAGAPTGWTVGDKTGTCAYGSTNDIGIIWPPGCSPIVIAIYFTQNEEDATPRDDVIAAATRLLIHAFSQADQCLTAK
jgi:beta-lactamase class A